MCALTIPEWINKDFFEKVLNECKNDNSILVKDYNITPGSKIGDNFGSIVYRAKINYASKSCDDSEISVIIKILPSADSTEADFLTDGCLFDIEVKMYTFITPEIQRLLKDAGDDTVIGPKLLYHAKDPNYVMVLEDVTVKGYQMYYQKFNLEEAKMLFKKLSRWHASVMYMDDYVPEVKTFNRGAFHESSRIFTDLWVGNFELLSKEVATWPGYESIAIKLENIKESIFEKVLELYKGKKGNPYNLLVHGDCHVKNMMLKKEGDRTVDFLLLDYQLSCYSSVGIDILYAFYNSISYEIRAQHRDELLKYYHDELTETLIKLGYGKKYPTLLELEIEMMNCGCLEVVLACVFSVFTVMDYIKEKAAENLVIADDLANQNQWEDISRFVYKHPLFIGIAKTCLKDFLYKGFLDD